MKNIVIKNKDLRLRLFKKIMKDILLPYLDKSQVIYINVYHKEITSPNFMVRLCIEIVAKDYKGLEKELGLRFSQIISRVKKNDSLGVNDDIILCFEEISSENEMITVSDEILQPSKSEVVVVEKIVKEEVLPSTELIGEVVVEKIVKEDLPSTELIGEVVEVKEVKKVKGKKSEVKKSGGKRIIKGIIPDYNIKLPKWIKSIFNFIKVRVSLIKEKGVDGIWMVSMFLYKWVIIPSVGLIILISILKMIFSGLNIELFNVDWIQEYFTALINSFKELNISGESSDEKIEELKEIVEVNNDNVESKNIYSRLKDWLGKEKSNLPSTSLASTNVDDNIKEVKDKIETSNFNKNINKRNISLWSRVPLDIKECDSEELNEIIYSTNWDYLAYFVIIVTGGIILYNYLYNDDIGGVSLGGNNNFSEKLPSYLESITGVGRSTKKGDIPIKPVLRINTDDVSVNSVNNISKWDKITTHVSSMWERYMPNQTSSMGRMYSKIKSKILNIPDSLENYPTKINLNNVNEFLDKGKKKINDINPKINIDDGNEIKELDFTNFIKNRLNKSVNNSELGENYIGELGDNSIKEMGNSSISELGGGSDRLQGGGFLYNSYELGENSPVSPIINNRVGINTNYQHSPITPILSPHESLFKPFKSDYINKYTTKIFKEKIMAYILRIKDSNASEEEVILGVQKSLGGTRSAIKKIYDEVILDPEFMMKLSERSIILSRASSRYSNSSIISSYHNSEIEDKILLDEENYLIILDRVKEVVPIDELANRVCIFACKEQAMYKTLDELDDSTIKNILDFIIKMIEFKS